ncbi:Uncharacterised protein [Segatella copri]|nr:Uncharacterised protein [Segatella copri]
MVFNGPSIYPNLMFFVFSIKSVEDIYDLLSILVFLAAVDEISLDMLQAGDSHNVRISIRLQFPVRSICITLYGTFIIREYVKYDLLRA